MPKYQMQGRTMDKELRDKNNAKVHTRKLGYDSIRALFAPILLPKLEMVNYQRHNYRQQCL